METSTTTGTGTYTLAGAVTGFQSFSGLGDSNSCYYSAEAVDANGNPSGDWEVGIGTYTSAGTTLSRDTILKSSNSNNAVSWAAGTKRIFITLPAAQIPSLDAVFGAVLKRAKIVNGVLTNQATGDHDFYTAPTGRACLLTQIGYNNINPASGNVGFYPTIKVSGTYYRIRATQTVTNTSISINPLGSPIVINPGESISFNAATNNGINAWMAGIEFDSDSPLKQAKLVGLSTGDNTLYTCPTGKTALVLGSPSPIASASVANSIILFGNDSGGARTLKLNTVPSGGSPGTDNQSMATTTVNNNQSNTGTIVAPALAAGDFFNVNIDTGHASTIAIVTILEQLA